MSEPHGVLRWEAPPAKDTGAPYRPVDTDWWRIAAQLRGRPGEWAAIAEGKTPTQHARIRAGTMRAFHPAGTFDAVGRSVDGVYTIYARYVGEVSR